MRRLRPQQWSILFARGARLAEDSGAAILTAYLDHYVLRLDCHYDQHDAVGALLNLDERLGTDRAACWPACWKSTSSATCRETVTQPRHSPASRPAHHPCRADGSPRLSPAAPPKSRKQGAAVACRAGGGGRCQGRTSHTPSPSCLITSLYTPTSALFASRT
ncbi:DUF6000 family protein [Streptosporangium canum]|uniref:DUF6000 family protein n=1 Tax=Streptosporangium canum TaxID=324952 RepID=UPI000B824D4D